VGVKPDLLRFVEACGTWTCKDRASSFISAASARSSGHTLFQAEEQFF